MKKTKLNNSKYFAALTSIRITGDAGKKSILKKEKKDTLIQVTTTRTNKTQINKKNDVQIKSLDLMEKVNRMKVHFVVDMLIKVDQKEDDYHYRIDLEIV